MPAKSTRILTLIWPSNYPNFDADSIFVFNRIMFREIQEACSGIEVIVAGLKDMPEIHSRVKFLPLDLGTTKYEARLGFSWNEMRNLMEDVRPDVCLINMPEQAVPLAFLIKDVLGLPCKLVSYVHYIPAMPSDESVDKIVYEKSIDECGHGHLLLMRLLEGVLASDVTLIPSKFGMNLLSQVARSLLKNPNISSHLKVLHPPVDLDEVSRVKRKRAQGSGIPRFVYNHRLYDEYGTHRIFDLLRDIHRSSSEPFEVLLTNPTTGRSLERARLNPLVDRNLNLLQELPFVRVQHYSDRTAYIEALTQSCGGIAPYKPHALWSMSVMDVMACGRPVLSFDIAAFTEMGIPEDLLVSCDDGFKNIFQRLVSSKTKNERENRYCSVAKKYGGTATARRFLKLVDLNGY